MDVVTNSFVIPLYFIFCKKKEEERLGGRKQRYIYSYIIKFNTQLLIYAVQKYKHYLFPLYKVCIKQRCTYTLFLGC